MPYGHSSAGLEICRLLNPGPIIVQEQFCRLCGLKARSTQPEPVSYVRRRAGLVDWTLAGYRLGG